MDFRKRIKEVCQIKGITQKDLAEKLGITDISLNKTLRGEYPQLQSLEKIANALNVDITELFDAPSKSGTIGIIRHNGEAYGINSIEDIRQLLTKIEKGE
ncbi:helix-turn-helix protein [Dysgonomonas alginatilytica]|uniref:Helix-turn-helix protein n=1 Tax=Dysgonomonas alginatilytica TaxID=1605892 RepID=A0A2V3PM08_9BACT|nr:helix-turn-helix transcriptional regulator [Dysgonomonas alginatilytica]PXV61246.1 helix-turn-helix protein [Dysgonomonas alginatilytica]